MLRRRSEVRQARLDRRVHSEESVAFSISIDMELDCEGVRHVNLHALNIKNSNFDDVTSLFHSGISDIIFLYQFAQACPHNVLYFLVSQIYVLRYTT